MSTLVTQTRSYLHGRTLRYRRDLIAVLLVKEIKVRYKSTVLGYAWSLLNPLAFAMVFWFVFRVFMKFPEEQYLLFLITGMFPWQFFSNSVSASNGFFLANGWLIKKVNFPRHYLVVAGVLNDMVHFLATLPVILVVMSIYHVRPTVHWLWALPLLVVLQFFLTLGVSLIIATTNLFFRDLERLTAIMVLLWFYLTPVIYPQHYIPERYKALLYANPMAPIMVCWRALFLDGFSTGHRPWLFLLTALGWAALFWVTGMILYRKMKRRFAELV